MRFSGLVWLLERNGFRLLREKGSVRYCGKPGLDRILRVDYHGAKEVPHGNVSGHPESGRIAGRGHRCLTSGTLG
jgi:predicted RNA binding protein YcfA (HicA-like mRNA interferase family)